MKALNKFLAKKENVRNLKILGLALIALALFGDKFPSKQLFAKFLIFVQE